MINDLSDTLNLKSKYGRSANLTRNINGFNEINSLMSLHLKDGNGMSLTQVPPNIVTFIYSN